MTSSDIVENSTVVVSVNEEISSRLPPAPRIIRETPLVTSLHDPLKAEYRTPLKSKKDNCLVPSYMYNITLFYSSYFALQT